MKIFVSHKSVDEDVAVRVAGRLKRVHGLATYLDSVDPALARKGEDLAEYLRRQMGSCSHLLAVVSAITKTSWWVPWEIGVASEKRFPLATFASGSGELPDYLKKWPYLRSDRDLDRYAEAVKQSEQARSSRSRVVEASQARREAGEMFYKSLRISLGQ